MLVSFSFCSKVKMSLNLVSAHWEFVALGFGQVWDVDLFAVPSSDRTFKSLGCNNENYAHIAVWCIFFLRFLVQVQPNESWLPLPTKELGFPLSAQTVPDVSAQWPACPVLDQSWSLGLLQGLISLWWTSGQGEFLKQNSWLNRILMFYPCKMGLFILFFKMVSEKSGLLFS